MYAVLVKRQNHCGYDDIAKELKRSYRSFDYMTGFLDGYLFGQYKLVTTAELEENIKKHTSKYLDDYHLFFVCVYDAEKEE